MKVDPRSWTVAEGQFVGNECSWPYPSGAGVHGCKQFHVNQFVVEQARQLGGKLLLTLDSHFVAPETKWIQDILLQNGNKNGWRASSAYYQMDTEQAWTAWKKNHNRIPDCEKVFCEAVENNTLFASMVERVDFPKKYHLPRVEIPPSIKSSVPDEDTRLVALTLERIRFHGRLPKDPAKAGPYLERLEKELQVIAYNGLVNFLPYFLIIDIDICSFVREQGRLVGPGRGSAAGCLLAYLLGITHIDPLVWGLSFERFLSGGRIKRGKFPDIDLDFGDPKIVVNQLADKYDERFARICTTGTAKLKGAIRDVARILLNTADNPEISKKVNEICETIDNVPQGMDIHKWLYGYEDGEGQHPGHLEQNEQLRKFFEEYGEVHRAVDKVLDVPRSVGRHASAYCLSDEPIGSLVPMCDVKGEICTQFTMGPVESMGLIKMDFLGLNTLNDIEGALKIIKRRHGIDIDICRILDEPLTSIAPGDTIGVWINDPKVFSSFCRGDNATVFQFKSDIATNLCRETKPRSVLDLANITANGRPGTMYALMEDGKTTLIDEWIQRRKKNRPITYLHPDLEDILRPTDGIFTYQEQIMAAFVKCCGYTEEKADEIREIVGKKKKDQMDKLLPDIRERLARRGWRGDQIDSFISLCIAASSYSFNKSHSVAYAYLGYVCQYLKTHFKIEWWNSVLENSNHDDLKDAAKHVYDIVVPPDINFSSLDFYIIDEGIGKLVFPINKVKNVKGGGDYIVRARNPVEGGGAAPFTSLKDFYDRVDRRKVNKRVVASLIWCGAFDKLCGVGHITERNRVYQEYLAIKGEKKMPREFSEIEILRIQMGLLAIVPTDLSTFIREKMGHRVLCPHEALNPAKYKPKDFVRVGGMASNLRLTKTKTGKNPGSPMAFLDLEDRGDTIAVTVFPEQFAKFQPCLEEGAVLCIDGKLNAWKDKINLVAEDIKVVRDEIEELNLDSDKEPEKEK